MKAYITISILLSFSIIACNNSDDVNNSIYYQGYMSGGAGYILSREALKRFVEGALKNKYLCKASESGSEDAEMGKCLERVGVHAGEQ